MDKNLYWYPGNAGFCRRGAEKDPAGQCAALV